MNYFDKISKIDHALGKTLKQEYPCLWPLLFDYVEHCLMYKESNRTITEKNPLKADFHGTRNLYEPKFLAKTLFYGFLKPQTEIPKESILISFSLFHRFPRLSEKLIKNYKCVMMATKSNVNFAKKTPLTNYLKTDHLMYTPRVEKLLAKLLPQIRQHVIQCTTLDRIGNSALLRDLENELTAIVSHLATVIKENNVTQYICPYCCRYEEILICLACKQLGIPSKEICHGVNSHKLINSDNVVPTHADFLYVWSQQFYDNISLFEDQSRIKIFGYPKFDASQIENFKKQYPVKKLITYLSQPTYDVGKRTDEPMVKDYIEKEAAWRKDLILNLNQLKVKYGYQIRIRYHQGEKVKSSDCDRTAERAQLAALGFSISTGPLEQDLFESELCLGINSSTIFEAYVMGRNAFQVYFEPTGKDNYHNVVPVIEVREIETKLQENQKRFTSPKSELLFDLQKFLADEVKA